MTLCDMVNYWFSESFFLSFLDFKGGFLEGVHFGSIGDGV